MKRLPHRAKICRAKLSKDEIICWVKSSSLIRRSNCSAPIPPPRHPGDITFWGVAPVFLSLYFYLALP